MGILNRLLYSGGVSSASATALEDTDLDKYIKKILESNDRYKRENLQLKQKIAEQGEKIEERDDKIKEYEQKEKDFEERIKELEERIIERDLVIEKLTGLLKNQIKHRFDKKSEKKRYRDDKKPADTADTNTDTEGKGKVFDKNNKNNRNETPHGRKIPNNLPVVEKLHEYSYEECICPKCGRVYRKSKLYRDSYEVDIEIIIRLIHHKRCVYCKCCECEEVPTMITAPKPANIIEKSLYSNRVWALLLVLKYYSQVPVFRQIKNIWGQYGLDIPNSTVTGGFKKITECLVPLYNELIEISRQEEHWHADETRWKVFVDNPGKKTFNWWMWVFASARVVVYVLDRSRSSSVVKKHFGDDARGIVNVDRFSAYFILAGIITRALCWYHQRRDFIKAEEAFPELKEWTSSWLDRIAVIEEINNKRVENLNNEAEFEKYQLQLEEVIAETIAACEKERASPSLKERQKKILKSMSRNREGLTVFVNNPLVPMHNNYAEQLMRAVALCRNNFLGSRVEWSGQLGAMCLSICKTADKHGLNPQAYLEYYFIRYAEYRRNASFEIKSLLPWNLSEEVIQIHNLRK